MPCGRVSSARAVLAPSHGLSHSPGRPVPDILLRLFQLLDRLVDHRQRHDVARAEALVFGQLLTLGRHTITQSLVALGLVDDDWSGFYRLLSEPRLDVEALRRALFRQTLGHTLPSEPYVVAVDGVQVPRHSRTMPGSSWLRAPRTPVWKPGIHRAQRFGDRADDADPVSASERA